MQTCNKIENGSCAGCNVPAMLWKRITPQNRDRIDVHAQEISAKYCPTESGGIDEHTKGIIYDNRVPIIKIDTIW